jgi:hypothetical protein
MSVISGIIYNNTHPPTRRQPHEHPPKQEYPDIHIETYTQIDKSPDRVNYSGEKKIGLFAKNRPGELFLPLYPAGRIALISIFSLSQSV